jgi:hypothetical protein
MLYDIHVSLDPATSTLETNQLRGLMSCDNPLWDLYNEWQRRDFSHMDDIKDVITETADERAVEIDPDPFGLNEEEAEGGIEP